MGGSEETGVSDFDDHRRSDEKEKGQIEAYHDDEEQSLAMVRGGMDPGSWLDRTIASAGTSIGLTPDPKDADLGKFGRSIATAMVPGVPGKVLSGLSLAERAGRAVSDYRETSKADERRKKARAGAPTNLTSPTGPRSSGLGSDFAY